MLSQGVKHMLWAGIFFSFMNLGVKLLPDMPVMQIVFFRALFVLVITFIYLKKNHIAILGNNKKILLLRGLFGFLALSLYFYTIQHMPFASAVIIMQLSPIFTTLFAIVLLKEKIKPLQLVFFFLSFVGVLFIKGFDTRISVVMLAIALLAAAISALAYNMIRLLKDTDHAMVVVFYFPLVAIPFSGTYTAFHFQMPTAYQWFILLLVSISTQIAQVNMTKAYQLEAIAKVTIVKYLTIVYAVAYSYFFFNESYNVYTYLGMLLVVTGILVNIAYTKKNE